MPEQERRIAAGVLVYQVVRIYVVASNAHFARVAVFTQAYSTIFVNDVVGDDGVVVDDSAGRITDADENTTADKSSAVEAAITKHEIIGNLDVCGSVPQVDSPGGVAVDDIVPDVPAPVG